METLYAIEKRYQKLSSLKKGDEITDFLRQKTGIVIGSVGVGYLVRWTNG